MQNSSDVFQTEKTKRLKLKLTLNPLQTLEKLHNSFHFSTMFF